MARFFATAAKGTEPALRDELRALGFSGVCADRGGVHFEGDWSDAWRCCLWSQIAMTVLAPLREFEAATPEALYEGARAVDWTRYLSPHHTLCVRAVCRDSQLRHSGFVALKVKDAVVDAVRDRCGSRPNVDREDPDLIVFVRVVRDRALIALDLAGEPLYRRGYRPSPGPAPLKESLAATLVRLAGWAAQAPLVDPFCGSGVIPIEAALLAGRRAPGLLRARFGFERWADYDAAAQARMRALREDAATRAQPITVDIIGGDLAPSAIDAARHCARRAGVTLRFYRGAFDTYPYPASACVIVTNPPYGHRLAVPADLVEGFRTLLQKRANDGFGILTAHPALARMLSTRKDCRHWILYNGALRCRFFVRHAVVGSVSDSRDQPERLI